MPTLARPVLLLTALLPLPGAAWAQRTQTISSDGTQGSVRIYRCISSSGALSLQNAPCENARQQQVLDMQRPRDPLPRPATTLSTDPARAAAAQTPLPQREIRIISVQPPQPMYECVTSEGRRYTSDDNEGNPRWVPLWTIGYVRGYGDGHHHGVRGGSGSGGNAGGGNGGNGNGGGEGGRPRPPRPLYPSAGVVVPAGSTLIRDTCNALPPQEVCARLSDRRWELIRRYNSALQSERRALETEQRSIDARLDRDCGSR